MDKHFMYCVTEKIQLEELVKQGTIRQQIQGF